MSYIPLENISVTVCGKEFNASFRVDKKMLEVHYGSIIKSTQLGASDPETLAKLILSEIVKNNDDKD